MGDTAHHSAHRRHLLLVPQAPVERPLLGLVVADFPQHLVQPLGNAAQFLGAGQGRPLLPVAGLDPVHHRHQGVDVAPQPPVMAPDHHPQHQPPDGQPANPGGSGHLGEGLLKVLRPAGDLDKAVDAAAGVGQRHEVGKHVPARGPLIQLLLFPGPHHPGGRRAVAQAEVGDAGRGQHLALGIEHRGAVHLADGEHRRQGALHPFDIVVGEGIADGPAHRPGDQLDVFLEPLALGQVDMMQGQADAQRQDQPQRQHHIEQHPPAYASAADPVSYPVVHGLCIILSRMDSSHYDKKTQTRSAAAAPTTTAILAPIKIIIQNK
ncbi:hypothetical protein CGX12_06265 [Zobellella denitrificans]|nr:hypothetical protein CGX12_06265 [Zobellella denitrificans]